MENIIFEGFFDGTLKVLASGCIDASNASECENKFLEILKEHPADRVSVNARELEYISSAGLRVIIKVKKAVKDLRITDVTPEVYDIFEVTGFTNIINISKKFRKFSAAGCTMLGKGGCGEVYRIDDETIIKVYTDGSSREVIEGEMNRAKQAFICGVPTAISYDVVECDGKLGVIYEKVEDTLAQRICGEPDRIDEYAKRYAEMLKTLHTADATEKQFGRFRDHYHENVDKLGEYFNEEQMAKIHKLIDSIPYKECLIHGDCHPNNVMFQGDEMVLIDMAEVACDHPVFEFGALYQDLVGVPEQNSKALVGIEKDQGVYLWKRVINSYFGTEDEQKIKTITRMCDTMRLLRMVLFLAQGSEYIKRASGLILKVSNEKFFPQIDELTAFAQTWEDEWDSLFTDPGQEKQMQSKKILL